MMENLAHGDVDKTLEEFAKQFEGQDLDNMPELDAETEESLKKFMDEFEKNPDVQNFMEDMMQKLVSKDILYEPIKELKDQVPYILSIHVV